MNWRQTGQGRYFTASIAITGGAAGAGSMPSTAPWRSRLAPSCSNMARSSQSPPQTLQAWASSSPIRAAERALAQAGQGAPSGAAAARATSAAPQAGQWVAERGAKAKQAGQATEASWAWQ